MWRLQGSGAIFVCWVSVKLRLLFTAGPYWQVVSARCAVWIFIDLWNLRPQNACSLSFLRPALKICVKNADFCVNVNPDVVQWSSRGSRGFRDWLRFRGQLQFPGPENRVARWRRLTWKIYSLGIKMWWNTTYFALPGDLWSVFFKF